MRNWYQLFSQSLTREFPALSNFPNIHDDKFFAAVIFPLANLRQQDFRFHRLFIALISESKFISRIRPFRKIAKALAKFFAAAERRDFIEEIKPN